MVIHPVKIADGHVLEKYCRVLTDLLISCHKGIIRVHFRCLFIVISRSNLCDIADLILIPVRDQTELGMYLISLETVDYTASGLLHPLGPVDVVLLVKTCPQFDERGHFLAVLRRGAEVFHKPCLLCQTVDRDLDRHDIRV